MGLPPVVLNCIESPYIAWEVETPTMRQLPIVSNCAQLSQSPAYCPELP